MAKNGSNGKVCKCGIPVNHKFHRHGCPPKHRRPHLLALIAKEEREQQAADEQWLAQQAAGAD